MCYESHSREVVWSVVGVLTEERQVSRRKSQVSSGQGDPSMFTLKEHAGRRAACC